MSFLDVSVLSLIFAKTLSLLLMLDPLGNAGLIATLLGKYDLKTQGKILKREVLAALAVMLIFFFFGSALLKMLGVSQEAVEITGGMVLLFFAFSLLFPKSAPIAVSSGKSEPFIVPIAVPLIAGPSSLATIMLFSHESTNNYIMLIVILLAWGISAITILLAPGLLLLLGKSGQSTIEKLMGLVCALIAVGMFLKGIKTFIDARII